MTNLVAYPQMRKVVEYYTKSAFYGGEHILTIKGFRQSSSLKGNVIILGRTGNFHHYDLSHIRMLREKGKLPPGDDTTVVLFDWHEDIDHNPKGTRLTSASWAYLGLEQNLYSNLYILGTDPRGFNELNPYQYEEGIRPSTEEALRLLDRIYLFPAAECFYCLKFFPDCEPFLGSNESVAEYFVVKEGGFVEVKFRSMKEVNYRNRKEGVIVSIDLDVLKKSEIKTDCPQGVMSLEELLSQLDKLQKTGSIVAFLICGLTESQERQDEISLRTLSRILAKCSQILERK